MPRTEDPVSGRAETSVDGAMRNVRHTHGLDDHLASPAQLSDRLASIVSVIKRTLKCEAVGIRLIDEDGNATYQVQDGFPDDFSAQCQSVSLYRDDCMCMRLLNTSDPGAAVFNEQETFMAGSACEFRSVLLCRIRYMDINLGLIHCSDTRSRRFSAESVKLLEAFASTIGRSLFYDSLWSPAGWVRERTTAPLRAVCSICGRHRDDRGRWFDERRLKPRISWSVLRLPRVICPHCLRFSTLE